LTEINLDAFREHPRRWGLFAGDRVEVGNAVIDAGIRYDGFAPGGEFAKVPGRIFSNAAWTQAPSYAAAVDSVFTPGRTQQIVSPRLRLAYAVAAGTTLRFGVGQQVEPPAFDVLFENVNSDLNFINASGPFGRDVDYGKTTLVEVGAHRIFGSDLALDVSLFNKSPLVEYEDRITSYNDPAVPGSTLNVNVLTTVSKGHSTGIDAGLQWRSHNVFSGSFSYSYVRRHRETAGMTTQALYVLTAMRAPSTWRAGTVLGAAASGVSASATLRLTDGLPYTRLRNTGLGVVAPGAFPGVLAIETFNGSRLPWTKTVDLRLAKRVERHGVSWTLYADVRNLLDFTNAFGAYAETGTQTNDLYRTSALATEYQALLAEASGSQALLADGTTVDLTACSTWSSPVNCVALRRVESRFGNGDGLYTRVEQNRAFNTFFDSFFGAWRFYGHGRTIRAGLELGF
jgi:hypothetical protein